MNHILLTGINFHNEKYPILLNPNQAIVCYAVMNPDNVFAHTIIQCPGMEKISVIESPEEILEKIKAASGH